MPEARGCDATGLDITELVHGDDGGLVPKVIKAITIETVRHPNDCRYEGFFPPHLNYRGHISIITFSHPVGDYRGNKITKLTLKTAWFSGAPGRIQHYWHQHLEGEGLTGNHSVKFGELLEHFLDYSEDRLRKWQQQGLNVHESTLARIKELYYQPKQMKLPRNFFDSS